MKTYIAIREQLDFINSIRVRVFRMKKGQPVELGATSYAPPLIKPEELNPWLTKQACQLIAKEESWGKKSIQPTPSDPPLNGVEQAIHKLEAHIYFL